MPPHSKLCLPSNQLTFIHFADADWLREAFTDAKEHQYGHVLIVCRVLVVLLFLSELVANLIKQYD